MELRQLEYLVTVIDEASFTRAAQRLHVTQPGISAQIKKLEREIGEALLDRSGPRVTCTDVGAVVAEHARAALAAVGRIGPSVAEHAGLLAGRVRIGVIGAGIPPALPGLLAAFARAHPAVEITLTEGAGGTQLDSVLDGGSELAIVGVVGELPGSVGALTLTDERIVAAVAARHPFARRKRITLAEVVEQPVIALRVGNGLRAGIDAALQDAGLHARVAYEAATPAMLCEFAAHGLGVALVPESVVPFVDGVVAVPLVSPAMRGRVSLVWPVARPIAPAGRALVAHLRHGLAPAQELPGPPDPADALPDPAEDPADARPRR